jgi:hypothetical protein
MAELLAVALGVLGVAIVVWDVAASWYGQPYNTVSNIIGEWSHRYPATTFAAGMLAGHLFWQRVQG